jgi:hypothetical protein
MQDIALGRNNVPVFAFSPGGTVVFTRLVSGRTP